MGMPPIENERVYSYVGNGAPVLIRRVLGAEATEAQVQEALEFFLEYYRDHMLDYTVLYPGVREALDRLRDAGVRMAVLTNKPVRISRAIVDGLGRRRTLPAGLRRQQFRFQETAPHRDRDSDRGMRRFTRNAP